MRIFQQDWLILGTLSMDKGKYGNLGCTFGWFGALRGAPSTTDGLLRVSGYRPGRWKPKRSFRFDFIAKWAHTSHFEHGQRKMLSLAYLVGLGPLGGPLVPQMADLGCQDTDRVGGNKKEVLDFILMQNGLTLATLSMDQGKYGDLGCISG